MIYALKRLDMKKQHFTTVIAAGVDIRLQVIQVNSVKIFNFLTEVRSTLCQCDRFNTLKYVTSAIVFACLDYFSHFPKVNEAPFSLLYEQAKIFHYYYIEIQNFIST